MDKNKTAINLIKEKLYSRKKFNKKTKRRKLIQKSYDINNSWKKLEKIETSQKDNFYELEPPKKTFFVKLLFSSVIFFISSLIFIFFVFFFEKNEKEFNNLEISVIGPNSINSNEELEFTVKAHNKNDSNIKSLNLSIYYPEGSVDFKKEIIKKKRFF